MRTLLTFSPWMGSTRSPVERLMRLLSVVLSLGLHSALPVDAAVPSQSEGAHLTIPRAGHQATLLADGRVLVTGGCARPGCADVQRTTERYDAGAHRFTRTADMGEARVSHTATALGDGRILVTGGWTGSLATASTEIYDPGTGRFTPGPRMSVARMDGTATLLDDGEVLIVGGAHQTGRPTATAERFDPASAALVPTGRMGLARVHHAAVRLRDGRVLVVGGLADRATATASAEIYDPSDGMFRPTGSLQQPRCKLAALPLADGRVMVLAGSSDCDERRRLATTEIFDPATESFVPGPRLNDPRYKFASAAVRLGNGAVLIAGGAVDMEMWTPGATAFRRLTAALHAELAFSTATLLGDGAVLVVGGYDRTITPTTRAWRISLPSAER